MVKCPFKLTTGFNPADGSWYWVTDTTYGGSFTEAKGDGTTDDRAAIQSCIDAAAAAGKGVYFPAGTYHMHPSAGDIGLDIPSNIILRGVGATSILEMYDDGTNDETELLQLTSVSNVTIRDLALTGTQTNKEASVECIICRTVSGLTLEGVSFDKCEGGLLVIGTGYSSNFSITNCSSGTNCLSPFFLTYLNGSNVISGGTYYANTVDSLEGEWPHHMYVAGYVSGLTVDGCTFIGGQNVCIDISNGNNGGLTFTDITMTDVVGGFFFDATSGEPIVIDGFTGYSTRFWGAYPWLYFLAGADYITVKNFAITGDTAATDYLVLSNGGDGTHNLLQNGTMTSSAYTGNTPKGSLSVNGGVLPTYDNVTVS